MKTVSPHRWPAEWERQTATWLAWPHNLETWPNQFHKIPAAFKEFAGTLARLQPVNILTGPADIPVSARSMLGGFKNIELHDVPTNDCWIRDYGPTFVTRKDDGTLVGVDWKFNAWGGKYPPYDDDARAAEYICRKIGCPRSVSAMHCEGGALEGDGQGTLLTTTSCLRSASRNPGWTLDMIEGELRRQLGVTQIIWVDGGGLRGDDTDGHIDQLARFVAPGIVVAATSSMPDDPNFTGLEANVRILQQAHDARGNLLTVHRLPTPPPRFVEGKRVPESYCNFLFVNNLVLVPTFRHPATDGMAIDLLTNLIPDRRVMPLDAYDLIWGLGAFHCASQQQPAPERVEPKEELTRRSSLRASPKLNPSI